MTHELVRHRIASYSQRSQRYVKKDKPSYFTPPELGDDIRVNARYYSAMENAWAAYKDLLKSGIKPEIARYVLPNACMTKIVCTWNLREIRHIIALRAAPEAQPEMREVANLILEHALEIAPNVFGDLAPAEPQYKVVADEMVSMDDPAEQAMITKLVDKIHSQSTCHHEYSKPYQTFVTSWGGDIVNCKKCGKGTKLAEVFAQTGADPANASQKPCMTEGDPDKGIPQNEWSVQISGEWPIDPAICQHNFKELPDETRTFAGTLSVVYQCTKCGLVKVDKVLL